MKVIPYGSQYIDADDRASVSRAMKSGWLTQGLKLKEFEAAFCKYTGARYAIAVSSGTAALHIACLASGMKKNDEAITTPITFVATSNSIFYTGAKPVFADIDYERALIDVGSIKKKINSRTRAILPVDFAGLPCDLSEIKKVARKYGLIVIEDSCHALGATYMGSRVGNCGYSDMCIFSFHPVKHITTGEGGMVTTNSRRLYDKLLSLRSHGIYRNKEDLKKRGGWYYEMHELGFNYRMTELQAALGYSQMDKLGYFLKRRDMIARRYNSAFADALGDLVKLPEADFMDRTHSWHLYVFRLNDKKRYISRKRLYEALHSRGIGAQVHYIPVTSQPYYKKMGYRTSEFPNAERFYENTISLPLYPGITDAEIGYVIKTVKEIILGGGL